MSMTYTHSDDTLCCITIAIIQNTLALFLSTNAGFNVNTDAEISLSAILSSVTDECPSPSITRESLFGKQSSSPPWP